MSAASRSRAARVLVAVMATAVAGGCTVPPRSERARETVAHALHAPHFATPTTPALPGPGAGRTGAAVALNAECEGCHTDEAAEWRGSLHQRSNVEPAYRRAFAIEPMPFCRSCHAPEGSLDADATGPVSEIGVSCVTCHVSDGHLWASPSARPASAPHAVRRDAVFASAAACAPCHEFAFPGSTRHNDMSLIQSTVTEHTQSPEHAASCASCHMPVTSTGRRSHAFQSSRSPAFLRAALQVRATRASPTRVQLTLTPIGVGHALPTGDLFRRIEVVAQAFGTDHMVLASEGRYLTRHFQLAPGGGKRWLGDDRLVGDGTVVELELGDAARGRPVAWRVAYQRVAHPSGVGAEDATLEADVELARGELP